MISWEQLTTFNIYSPPKFQLPRYHKIQDKYDKFKLECTTNNIVIKDYLINKLFNNNEKFKFVPNEFEYYLESNINHYIFWINPNYNYEFNNTIVENIVKKILNKKKFIIFKNNDNNKSIPEIIHYHVFFKNNLQ